MGGKPPLGEALRGDGSIRAKEGGPSAAGVTRVGLGLSTSVCPVEDGCGSWLLLVSWLLACLEICAIVDELSSSMMVGISSDVSEYA